MECISEARDQGKTFRWSRCERPYTRNKEERCFFPDNWSTRQREIEKDADNAYPFTGVRSILYQSATVAALSGYEGEGSCMTVAMRCPVRGRSSWIGAFNISRSRQKGDSGSTHSITGDTLFKGINRGCILLLIMRENKQSDNTDDPCKRVTLIQTARAAGQTLVHYSGGKENVMLFPGTH